MISFIHETRTSVKVLSRDSTVFHKLLVPLNVKVETSNVTATPFFPTHWLTLVAWILFVEHEASTSSELIINQAAPIAGCPMRDLIERR